MQAKYKLPTNPSPLLENDDSSKPVPGYNPGHTMGTGDQEPHTLPTPTTNPALWKTCSELPLTPKPTVSIPSTSDAICQSIQSLGALYLALTGLIDSAFSAAGPWAVAGKALSYLVKLSPIIWWAMPVPASSPPSPEGAVWYSWYPDPLMQLIQWIAMP
ncbi:hypothetical protein DSO57_1031654 [Entomophthora muscae]|uniref:Uncharacterized protein n=1 Tax=Entomophthora muscae TaxID=34485 RepID=A0ACC2RRT0_9FUNG|nr:hypothetical protein DSO57_1031654 [Entomophthora muscae]